jgi:thiamine pyrophosphate-dependent acetolactate synthase large subunit-like protein
MDTAALEELNPYKFFDTACLYIGRVVNPEQARAVFTTAILTAVVDKGPTLISMPGDIASASAPGDSTHEVTIPAAPVFRPADADIDKLAGMIDAAKKVAIFGGDGCRDHGECRAKRLRGATRLSGPPDHRVVRRRRVHNARARGPADAGRLLSRLSSTMNHSISLISRCR